MPTYKRTCSCCGKTQELVGQPRGKTCQACRLLHRPIRLNTGKGWYVHKQTGYIIGSIQGVKYYQHRYIMEQSLGRKLTRKEHVHHINGNKTDNRIENLEVISASDHAREHTTEKNIKTKQHVRAANIRWGNI